jgi:hypothetical protein
MSQIHLDALNTVEQNATAALLPVAPPTVAAAPRAEAAQTDGRNIGDRAELSEEGRQLSAGAEENEPAASGPAVYDPSAREPGPADLRYELTLKNNEVAAVQAELEDLRKLAEEDPVLQAVLAQKRTELRNLLEEAGKLQSQIYL